MSAEDLGRRLLGDVQKESLDEVLRKLRNLNRAQNPVSIFNIPLLDRLLPQQQHADRQHMATEPSTLPQRQSKSERSRSDTLIEIVADSSSAGKTSLLYLITCFATLPDIIDGVELFGKNSAVVVVDTDDRFDVSRLSVVMRNHIKTCTSTAEKNPEPHSEDDLDVSQEPETESPKASLSDVDIESLIHTSLQHVHIFRPHSFSSLMATVKNLPSYLLSPDSPHCSRRRSIHSFILDSASAFYWQFRAQEETQRVLALDSDSSSGPTDSSNYIDLMGQLQSLSVKFECPVIATTWKLSSSSREDGPYLNPTFPIMPALRLEVRRVFTHPFKPQISVEQAESLRGMRHGAMASQNFRAEGAKAGFGFVVNDQGVTIVDDDTLEQHK